MERLGLVLRRPGSGTYVRSFLPRRAGGKSSDELDRSFAAWLEIQRGLGATAAQLDHLFTRWSYRSKKPRVAVLEPEEGLRRLIVEEVSVALPNAAVTGWATSDRIRGLTNGHCLLVRPDLVAALRLPDPAVTDLVVIRTAHARHWQRLVGRLRAGEVVALFTQSQCLRRYARELLGAQLSDRIGLAAPVFEREDEVERALRVANLVLADRLCDKALRLQPSTRSHMSRVPSTLVRVTGPTWLRALARYLGCRAMNDASRNLNAHEA